MSTPILDRIVRESGVPDLLEVLGERLGAQDLQSLLLEVQRRRAARGSIGSLLDRYRKSRFAKPSGLPPGALLELDRLAFSLLPPGFEGVELSPLAPLGATAIVTGTSQNRIVSTVRNTEVAADPTNALALECAVRRSAHLARDPRSAEPVRLAASQRVVRAQRFEGPASFAHFRLFALCAAGRDRGSFAFELESLAAQLAFHVRLVRTWRERGAAIGDIRVPLTPLEGGPSEPVVRERLLEPLAAEHPDVAFAIDPHRQQGRGYYESFCFHVYAEDPRGCDLQLADGGFTDWTQQLVGSRKERLLISGIGSDRLVGLRAS